MRTIAAVLLLLAMTVPSAVDAASKPKRDLSVMTLKERSSRKAMDPQRVNDCKVPYDQRGDHSRPAECGKPIRKQEAE
ncbi:hypothetical protein [Marinivivus vitaminiproducens]|uniref:hypothetical protein n=1 Tax=Marinivivus vitaminiproducens TaxID=3035935 RepID=UPI0027AA5891|nr:hypothetical protein P4R82_20955 [Geminicoccaceae bacterium SCSIO 64248]